MIRLPVSMHRISKEVALKIRAEVLFCEDVCRLNRPVATKNDIIIAEKRLCKNKSFSRNIIMQFSFQLHKAQLEDAPKTAISTPDNKRLLQAQVSA